MGSVDLASREGGHMRSATSGPEGRGRSRCMYTALAGVESAIARTRAQAVLGPRPHSHARA